MACAIAASAGGVIKTYPTGLRMGANYSGARGAAWLMKNRVLASRENWQIYRLLIVRLET